MNYHETVNVKAEQTHDWLQEAEVDRLLRQAGIDQRGWLRIQADKGVCRLGEILVAVGSRLICHESERRLHSSPLPLKDECVPRAASNQRSRSDYAQPISQTASERGDPANAR